MREGSIFKWRGKWAYEYVAGLDSAGKPIRKRLTFDKKADAVAAKKQIIASDPGSLITGRITVKRYLEDWLESVSQNQAKNTHRAYRSAVNAHLIPHLGEILLCDLNGLHVEAMLRSIDSSDSVKRYAHTVLKSALDRAVTHRLINHNPCNHAAKPRNKKRSRPDPFTSEEAILILEAAREHRVGAMIWMAFTTGARQGELLGLQWSNVNLDTGKVFFHRQAIDIGGNRSIDLLKTDSSIRHATLTPATADTVRERQSIAMREKLAACDLVFPSKVGTIMNKSSFYRHVWKPILLKAGVDYKNFHQARHSFATLALAAGVPITEVQHALGHSSPAQTLATYAHWISEDADRSRSEMERLFG